MTFLPLVYCAAVTLLPTHHGGHYPVYLLHKALQRLSSALETVNASRKINVATETKT